MVAIVMEKPIKVAQCNQYLKCPAAIDILMTKICTLGSKKKVC